MCEVGVEVAGEGSGEIGVGDGEGLELGHAGEDDEGAGGFDVDVGDGEVGEVLEVGEPDAGEFAEAVDAGEGGEGEGAEGGDDTVLCARVKKVFVVDKVFVERPKPIFQSIHSY